MLELDFSRLSVYPKAAIMTHNKEQLAAIEEKMRREYPSRMRVWEPGELSEFEEDDMDDWYGAVCVAPHIYDDERDILQVADEAYWLDGGYALIDFEMLTEKPQDFGEIDVVDADVHILLDY